MKLAGDIETNGLLHDPQLNKVWCICTEEKSFGYGHISEGLDYLSKMDTLIFHNGIGFDFPVLSKLLDWEYTGRVIDTYILSQLLYPERPGGHSLEAWGQRLGFPKVEHEEWDRYSPEMLHRCETDAKLTRMVYDVLCEEAGEELEGIILNEYTTGIR